MKLVRRVEPSSASPSHVGPGAGNGAFAGSEYLCTTTGEVCNPVYLLYLRIPPNPRRCVGLAQFFAQLRNYYEVLSPGIVVYSPGADGLSQHHARSGSG